MGMTFAVKALGRAAGREVREGETVSVEPDLVITRDETPGIIRMFSVRAPGGVRSPGRIAIVLESPPGGGSERALVREFTAGRGIGNFFDTGSGACSHVLPEAGLCWPGALVAGTDPRTLAFGAFNACAFEITQEEAAAAWETGAAPVTVPSTACINLHDGLPARVSAKDLALRLVSESGRTLAGRAVEFHGAGLSSLRMHERMTACSMMAATGAAMAVFPADGQTREFIRERGAECSMALWSDVDAVFVLETDLDMASTEPMVMDPAGRTAPVGTAEGVRIGHVLLGTCENGRAEDLRAAASVLKGRRTDPSVLLAVMPGSREVMLKAIRTGVLEELVTAGAVVIPPGCGPCTGLTGWSPPPDEACLSTGGQADPAHAGVAQVYIASPETAAATALTGRITDPRGV